jgi:acylphosphatase
METGGQHAAGEKRIARRYFVSGMVQGVGYRFFVQRVAGRLGLQGYVKNLTDGRVEAYAIGAPASLAEFRAELERGPNYASVSGIAENDAEPEDRYSSTFSIEHDSW